ncbi:MAG: histidinol dehydrogenase [Nitriliruptoraceae bacterium]
MARLRVLDLRGDRSDPSDRFPRPRDEMAHANELVTEVITRVRRDGDDALLDYTRQFDNVELDSLAVPREVLQESLASLDPGLRTALERAVRQVRWFHEQARPSDWVDERDGIRMGQWYRPVSRVGVYVPGGKAVYPSTVVMTVVPALVAGVDEVVLCTPPTGGDGYPNRVILAAAELVGVTRVFAVGGAQAIAAMAYGTASVPVCDKVVGPGNIYVAVAKQQVQAAGV